MGSRQIAQQETEVNDLYSFGQLTHRPLQFAFHSHAARTRPAPPRRCGVERRFARTSTRKKETQVKIRNILVCSRDQVLHFLRASDPEIAQEQLVGAVILGATRRAQ